VRGGTAKLLTLFRPATGEVRAEPVEHANECGLASLAPAGVGGDPGDLPARPVRANPRPPSLGLGLPPGRAPAGSVLATGVQWHQPGLGELGFADYQQFLVAIEIGGVQRDRLADSQAARREQPDQRLVRRRAKAGL
jgi:hypothetical protein